MKPESEVTKVSEKSNADLNTIANVALWFFVLSAAVVIAYFLGFI